MPFPCLNTTQVLTFHSRQVVLGAARNTLTQVCYSAVTGLSAQCKPTPLMLKTLEVPR